MFGNIIKNLYIGKSKLNFILNDELVEPTQVFGNILYKTGDIGNLPDYGAFGNLLTDNTFKLTISHPKHRIFVTGIPKGSILDIYRLKKVVWSSYYEDDHRGYLFQVTDDIMPRLLIKNEE